MRSILVFGAGLLAGLLVASRASGQPCGQFADALCLGEDGRVIIPDDPTLDLNPPFTVEAWLRYYGTSSASAADTIVEKAGVFTLGVADANPDVAAGNLTYRLNQFPCSPSGWCDGGASLPVDGAWHHVALVVDLTEVRTYLDGTLAATLPGSPLPLTTATDVILGDLEPSSFFGCVDEVRLSSVARSPSQFCLQGSCVPDANTVGLWSMDEGSGAIAGDGSGNGNDGAIQGSNWSCPVEACQSGNAWLDVTTNGTPGGSVTFTIQGAPNAPYLLLSSLKLGPQDFGFGTLCADPSDPSFLILLNGLANPLFTLTSAGVGVFSLSLPDVPSILGTSFFFQALVLDSSAPNGAFALSTGQGLTVGPNQLNCDLNTVALFHFEEDTGSQVSDVCGTEGATLVGILDGGADWISGGLGSGVILDGKIGHVRIPDPTDVAIPPTGQITIEAWVYLSRLPAPGEILSVFRKDERSCDQDVSLRFLNPGIVSLQFHYGLSTCTPGANAVAAAVPMIVPKFWYHIVGEYDGNALKLFVGLLGLPPNQIGQRIVGPIPPPVSGRDIVLGSRGGFSQFVLGLIDEVRISDVAKY